MIRILVTNQKGGVGKSTITANLCRYFTSIRNKKTTLLDFDSQASSSRWVKQVQQKDSPKSIRVMPFEVPRTGGLNRAVIELRRVMRQLEADTDIVVADLTWNDFLDSEIFFEFDLVVLPSAISEVELVTTIEFAKKHQWVFESKRYHPTLVLAPSRVRSDQNGAVHKTSERFPFSFVLTPPILDSIDAKRAFGNYFLIGHRNNRLASSFMSFCRAMDQSIELHLSKHGARKDQAEATNPFLHSLLRYKIEMAAAQDNAEAEKTVVRAGFPTAIPGTGAKKKDHRPWLEQIKEHQKSVASAAVSNGDTTTSVPQSAGPAPRKPPLALVPKIFAVSVTGAKPMDAVSPSSH
jgi:cellulose biosynthesis protein BcsQ